MSRSARNRRARNARRRPVVRGTVPPRPISLHTAVCPLDSSRIRAVGYLGHNPTRVHYSGSGADGYRSEWAGSPDFWTDRRWSATVSNREV